MRSFRLLFLAAGLGATAAAVQAADPVTVEVTATASVGKTIVTVGDVALISGGDVATREAVARMDVAELKARDTGAVVGRRAVEYRLRLAGFEPAAVRVTGSERTTVTAARRPLTPEEVTATARAELLRQYPASEAVVIELAQPVVVRLPEVPADERPVIRSTPRGKPGATGRVQMDTTVSAGGETLLAFAVYLNVNGSGAPAPLGTPGAGGTPAPAGGSAFAADQILIQPRQRVQMQVVNGGLVATAVGEAQQTGKFDQIIQVQNVDSKKIVSARVTGPGTVEINLGGGR